MKTKKMLFGSLVIFVIFTSSLACADFFCFERRYPAPFNLVTNLYCFDTDANNALITNQGFDGIYDRPQYYPYTMGNGLIDATWYLIDGTNVGIIEINGQYFSVDLRPLKRIPQE